MSKFLFRVRIAYRTHPVGTLLGAFLIYVVVAIALWAAFPGEADHVMTEAENFQGGLLAWVVLFFSLLVAPFLTSTRP
ncbi:MAG: hypothetical protein ABL962_17425 [Fimbriimonadaceae bacterium]